MLADDVISGHILRFKLAGDVSKYWLAAAWFNEHEHSSKRERH